MIPFFYMHKNSVVAVLFFGKRVNLTGYSKRSIINFLDINK